MWRLRRLRTSLRTERSATNQLTPHGIRTQDYIGCDRHIELKESHRTHLSSSPCRITLRVLVAATTVIRVFLLQGLQVLLTILAISSQTDGMDVIDTSVNGSPPAHHTQSPETLFPSQLSSLQCLPHTNPVSRHARETSPIGAIQSRCV